MVETRFVRPDAGLVDQIVIEVLRTAGAPVDPTSWTRIEHGSANLVVLAGEVAVRVSRSVESVPDFMRVQALVDRLPELPFSVPRSLTDPVRVGDIVAVGQTRLRGAPHPSGDGDPRQLRVLLEAIHNIPLDTVRADLAPARAFMGGASWFDIMTEQAIPLLAAQVQDRARQQADRLAALEPASPVLVHGDLAGGNVLWENGHVSAVLDWDLASADDPAEDVAALGTWHGWDSVTRATDAHIIRRARAFAATYPLQLICFALINSRPANELARAIDNANRRLLT
ncbi:phosphotransferase [Leifsonia soli]|uniref:Aminoglycoside phosphotransferase (APT) family kinase protein n=1 Tax=Leifsonia soli TaxID=582665 RepID=A0A852T4J5_9MICO|nr:aminoglycoside phosphotransferase (APT) family kinase protein [Leifsonia soli]